MGEEEVGRACVHELWDLLREDKGKSWKRILLSLLFSPPNKLALQSLAAVDEVESANGGNGGTGAGGC